MKKSLLVLALFFLSTTANAQAYKCKISGQTVFQDQPCNGALKRSEDMPKQFDKRQATNASPSHENDLDRQKAFLADREKVRKIESINNRIRATEGDIVSLQQSMNDELDVLRARKQQANNNLAGATLEQSISTEMQAVAERYKVLIDARKDELKRLREELASAQKSQ